MSPRSQKGDSKPKTDEPLDQPFANTSPMANITTRTITSLFVKSTHSTLIFARGRLMIATRGKRQLWITRSTSRHGPAPA